MPGGRPTKLTPAVTESICEAIRSTAPMHWAASYAGVDDSTVSRWRSTATAAMGKKPRERSQHERRCIVFFNAVKEAEAKAFVFGTTSIAAAARDAKLVRTVTTTRKIGDETFTTSVREEKQVSGEWRAMAHLMARRWPEDMGDRLQLEGAPSGEPIRVVSVEEGWAAVNDLKRQRELASTNGATTSASSGNGSTPPG